MKAAELLLGICNRFDTNAASLQVVLLFNALESVPGLYNHEMPATAPYLDISVHALSTPLHSALQEQPPLTKLASPSNALSNKCSSLWPFSQLPPASVLASPPCKQARHRRGRRRTSQTVSQLQRGALAAVRSVASSAQAWPPAGTGVVRKGRLKSCEGWQLVS